MIKLSIFVSLMLLIVSSGCNDHWHEEVNISTDDIATLKQKYSTEVINYFYETVFFLDRPQQKIDAITKWEKDINLIILGNPTVLEKETVEDFVELINQQRLPIKMTVSDKASDANYKIYFGTMEELDTIFDLRASTAGVVASNSVHGRMKNIKLGIIRNEDTGDEKRKRAVILEEMIQSLGVNGDSYTYPNSIFFEGRNFQDEFLDLDKQILQLLYDPLMPANYPTNKFETDFAEILYSQNTSERLQDYFQEQKVSKSILNQIRSTCFIDSVFYKHPRQVDLYIYGQYNSEDSVNVQKVISSLNNISNYMQLQLVPFTNYFPNSGIILSFKNREDQEFTVMSNIRTYNGKAMFPKRIRNEVDLFYQPSKGGQAKKNKTVAEIIYKCLGPMHMEDLEGLVSEEKSELIFGEDYKKILEIIYRPEFADGYTLDEFEKLIAEMPTDTTE